MEDVTSPETDEKSAAPGATQPGAGGNAEHAETGDLDELITVSSAHYQLGDEIARGGMGRIRSARDRRLSRPVAIKELLRESAGARARFEREARISARLQHPSIVSILEAGVWPNGDPFYAMKLVAGESLDKAIARAVTIEDRLALLPHVIAVVDALAYAHSNRVIHRDLKPGNVLVGEFGETVVIDWGLAKDLSYAVVDPSADPDCSAVARETAAGAVMGTPAYMPAEQASGATVDERADVYALGAMLYHLLTGQPPYADETHGEILAAVIAGPPSPLARRLTGAPPDLIAIVTKAMARRAADRYPTARELADDLKKFQAGQMVGAHPYSPWQIVGRWLRRHLAPVAVAGVAAVLLMVLAVIGVRRIVQEQARAEVQRRAAVQSRGDAEDLMSFMLVDLRDKLRPLNKLQLLDAVAQKAVVYYDQRSELDPREFARLAQARRNLGDVLDAQGRLDEALRQYRAALALVERLVAGGSALKGELSVSRQKIGDVLLEQGATADALAAYEAALVAAEAMPGSTAETEALRRRASVHLSIGRALADRSDHEGALGACRAAKALAETLAELAPDDAGLRRGLSVARLRIGDPVLALGRAMEALIEFRAALAVELAAARDPDDAVWQHDVSMGHYKIGSALLALGEAPGALPELQASLAIDEALAAGDPTNLDRQGDLSASHLRVGEALLAVGDHDSALAACRTALAVAEEIVAKDPLNLNHRRHTSLCHDKIGDVLAARGDLAGAFQEYRIELALDEGAAAVEATNPGRRRDLDETRRKVAATAFALAWPAKWMRYPNSHTVAAPAPHR